MTHRLEPLLAPSSIALIGANANAGRIGGMPLDMLRHFQYEGAVYPVNPKYEEVFGYRCYPDIESLPEAPDLAVLAIAAQDVVPMLRRCHAKGARAAIVYAAGFAEAGAQGQILQAELEAFVAHSGMVVAGPNCMGFANLNKRVYTAFASVFRHVPLQHSTGKVSIVTQSGNVCAAMFTLLRGLDVPVSHFVNTGNEAVLEFSEYLEYMAEDADTECAVGYVEQLRDGPRFINAALSFARQRKPLIVYKVGETDKGSEAVSSHTSALAGDLAIYHACFDQVNVIQSNDFSQMADLAYLSGFRQRSGGQRVAIVTMSGALGAILADKFIGAGLDVPTFSEDVQKLLRQGIPDYGMVTNPVDVTGNIVNTPDFVRHTFKVLAETDQVDTVVVYAPGYILDRMTDALIEVSRNSHRLFVAIDTGASQCRQQLADAGIPVFTDIGRATQALAPFCKWLANHERAARWAALRQAASSAPAAHPPSQRKFNEYESKQLLQSYGVPAPDERAVRDVDEAVQAARTMGYPVALKILSADIPHKTEAGGVRLHVGDDETLSKACEEMLLAVRQHNAAAHIEGFLVQPMAPAGAVELIAGITQDPVFGPVLTVGLGGVLTEIYRDVSHRLLPVDEAMVAEMLRELKAWPLLDGFRGRPMADVQAACDAVTGLSRAKQGLGHSVSELEVNPLLVYPLGQGAIALDALLLAPSVV